MPDPTITASVNATIINAPPLAASAPSEDGVARAAANNQFLNAQAQGQAQAASQAQFQAKSESQINTEVFNSFVATGRRDVGSAAFARDFDAKVSEVHAAEVARAAAAASLGTVQGARLGVQGGGIGLPDQHQALGIANQGLGIPPPMMSSAGPGFEGAAGLAAPLMPSMSHGGGSTSSGGVSVTPSGAVLDVFDDDYIEPHPVGPEARPETPMEARQKARRQKREVEEDIQATWKETSVFKRNPLTPFKGREGREQIGMGLGYTAIAAAAGYSEMEGLDHGQYVSPEERNSASVKMGAPTLGIALGTGIGLALGGPAGAYAGQLIGGAGGEAIAATVGAKDARDQATRETAEKLAASLGLAADAVAKFKQQITDTGAPVAQLGQGLTALQGFAPGVGEKAIAGAGRSALSQGQMFLPDLATTGKFLASNPALAPITSQYAQNGSELSRGQFRSIAELALTQGDMGAYNSAMNQATARGYNDDPQYQQAAQAQTTINSSWFNIAGSWIGGVMSGHNVGTEADQAMQARKKAVDGQNKTSLAAATAQDTATFLGLNAARQDLIQSGLDRDQAQIGMSIAEVTGRSDAQVARTLPGLASALGRNSRADESDIAILTQKLNGLRGNDAATDALRTAYQTDIGRIKSAEMQNPLALAQASRDIFERGQATAEGAFGLEEFNRTYTGQSAAQMRGMVFGRAGVLQATAANPNAPLSDAQRLSYRRQAEQMEVANIQQGYSQAEGLNDVRSGNALVGVAKAASYGTAGQELGAQNSYRSSLADQERQLRSELDQNNLSYDQRIAKMREIGQLQTQQIQNEVQSRNQYFAENDNMYRSQASALTADVGRVIRRGGNAAIDVAGVIGADDRTLDNLRAKLAANQDPKLADGIRADIAATTEQRNAFLEMSNTYSPNAADQQKDITMRGQMRRAMLMPYMDGPDSNRFAIGNRMIGYDKGQIGKLNANRAAKMKAGTWHPEDQTTYLGQLNGFENDISDAQYSERYELFNALPEMVSGAPVGGVGVSILPMQALAAAFSPNPTVGSFGRKSALMGSPLRGGSPALEGGASGAFSVGAVSATEGLLKQIADGVARLASSQESQTALLRGRSEARPVQDQTAVINHALGNGYDASRPYAGR